MAVSFGCGFKALNIRTLWNVSGGFKQGELPKEPL